MIWKQMMMIISLFMAAITIILATDEEQLAEASLPSVLTREGWAMLGTYSVSIWN